MLTPQRLGTQEAAVFLLLVRCMHLSRSCPNSFMSGSFVVPLINLECIPRYTKFRLKDEADPNVIICDSLSGPRFYGDFIPNALQHKRFIRD